MSNVFTNISKPYTGQQAYGALYSLAMDVIVSDIVRRFLKSRKTYTHLIATMGIGKFVEGGVWWGEDYPWSYSQGSETLTDSFKTGAMHSVGPFLGEYVVETANQGFHIPKPSMGNILTVIGCKALSRALGANIVQYMPEDLQNGLIVFNYIVANQQRMGLGRLVNKQTEETLGKGNWK